MMMTKTFLKTCSSSPANSGVVAENSRNDKNRRLVAKQHSSNKNDDGDEFGEDGELHDVRNTMWLLHQKCRANH